MRDTLSSSPRLRSVRFQYAVWSVLLAAMLVTLLSLINRASNFPTLTARSQTSDLPSSRAPHPLLNRPELAPLLSAHARHYDLDNRQLPACGVVNECNTRLSERARSDQ